jgi:hypothetical protein
MRHEEFSKEWHRALNKFTVLQHRVAGLPGQMTRYIHAEADTGSKYEFLGQEVQIDWRNPHDPTYVLVVMNPWNNSWTASPGSLIYPDYALEHWCSPHRTPGSTHGGDAAALVIGLNMLCGATIEEACTFASSFFALEES